MPTVSRVFSEAVVVAFGLVLLFYVLCLCTQHKVNNTTLINVALAGAIFHLICEYTGINKWYVQNYR